MSFGYMPPWEYSVATLEQLRNVSGSKGLEGKHGAALAAGWPFSWYWTGTSEGNGGAWVVEPRGGSAIWLLNDDANRTVCVP